MIINLACTHYQVEELANLALLTEYYYKGLIEKKERRAANQKLSKKIRERALSSIHRLEENRLQMRKLYEFIEGEKEANYCRRSTIVQEETAFLSQLIENMSDQGLMPEQYMSQPLLSLRLAQKFRMN